MTSQETTTHPEAPTPKPATHEVEITVNGKAVRLLGPHTTGLAIKQAAIAQAVAIQLDFILSEEIGPKKTRLVRDTDDVTIHPGSKFVAIPNDDNS
jgi:cell division protein ZapA (FtsZ GTPase activity inhibitor)